MTNNKEITLGQANQSYPVNKSVHWLEYKSSDGQCIKYHDAYNLWIVGITFFSLCCLMLIGVCYTLCVDEYKKTTAKYTSVELPNLNV